MERRTLTVPEVAEVLGISSDTVYSEIRKGRIPAVRFGRRLLVPCEAIDRLLQVGESA